MDDRRDDGFNKSIRNSQEKHHRRRKNALQDN